MIPIKLFSKGLLFLKTFLPCSFVFGQSYILIDSSANGYTLLGQDRECIAYNIFADAIVSVNRAFVSSGALNVHSASGNLSLIHHDLSAYNQEFGPARFPHTYAGDYGPYLSFPYLIGSQWGGVGGQYESGGWFSSIWNPPVDIGPGNIMSNRCYLKEVPGGDMHFVLRTAAGEWLYRTYTPDLQTLLESGAYPFTGWSYWGSDYNAGVFCVGFYKFLEPESLYKVVIVHSVVDTWDLAIPTPYAPWIEYTQLALTDGGSPLLVFSGLDPNDTLPPYRRDIFLSYASGVPPVRISAPFPDSLCQCIYPTIATGGNYAVVIFNNPRTDSVMWNDIFKSYSSDNGLHWSVPENITQWSPWRIGLQQLAKRVDTLRNRFYYIFARTITGNYDPLLYPDYPIYIYWSYNPIVGSVQEKGNSPFAHYESIKLEAFPNICGNSCRIVYVVPKSQKITLRLYDIVGREISCPVDGVIEKGIHSYILNTTHLSSGTYYLIINGEKEKKTEKLLIVR